MRCAEGCSNILISFIDPSSPFYLFQRGDGGALSAVVGVPVHVQNLFPIHRHDPGQNAFLHNIILFNIHKKLQKCTNDQTLHRRDRMTGSPKGKERLNKRPEGEVMGTFEKETRCTHARIARFFN